MRDHAARSERSERAKAVRVLLVDDEAGILSIFRRVLNVYGYEVEESSDARHAITLLNKRAFGIVVSDVHMPGVNGLQFVKMIHDDGIRVPVILMTGMHSSALSLEAVAAGAVRCLLKPVMPTTLREAIERALALERG